MIVGVKMFFYIWLVVAVHSVVNGVFASERTLSDESDVNVKGVYARFLEDLINTNEEKINAVKKLSNTKYDMKNYYRDEEKPESDQMYRSQIGMLVVVPQRNSNARIDIPYRPFEGTVASSEELELDSKEKYYYNYPSQSLHLHSRDIQQYYKYNPNERFKSDPDSSDDLEFQINKKYYNPPRHVLKVRDSVESSFEEDDEEDTPGFYDVSKESEERSNVITTQTDPFKFESQENDNGAIENKNDLNEVKNQINFLRKKWRSSCDKKAAKYCRRACRSAYRSACSDIDCSKKLKRRLKRNCKSKCESMFISN